MLKLSEITKEINAVKDEEQELSLGALQDCESERRRGTSQGDQEE